MKTLMESCLLMLCWETVRLRRSWSKKFSTNCNASNINPTSKTLFPSHETFEGTDLFSFNFLSYSIYFTMKFDTESADSDVMKVKWTRSNRNWYLPRINLSTNRSQTKKLIKKIGWRKIVWKPLISFPFIIIIFSRQQQKEHKI